MKNKSEFMQVNLTFGQWLYNFILLQFLPVFYTLKGVILFGIFPAIASTFNVFYRWFAYKEYDKSVSKLFKEFYTLYFWQANKLGWGVTIVGAFLLFDLYISSNYIQSLLLHTLLVGLFFIYLVISSYLFLTFSRYNYDKLSDYIKQSFYIGISSIFQSIAILLAMVVVLNVFSYVPFLLLFFGLPILFGAISWFAVQGILKAESMSENQAMK